MQNPSVQQFNLGFQRELPRNIVLRVDGVHNLGTHFIIGRTIGEVFNPVVGGPDRVVNLESSVNTHYDALLVSAERRSTRLGFRASYTFCQGAQLRQRRSDSVRERAHRSERTCASSTVRRRTTSGIASRSRRGWRPRPGFSWRPS